MTRARWEHLCRLAFLAHHEVQASVARQADAMSALAGLILGAALGAAVTAGVAYSRWPEKREPYYEEWWNAPEMWAALAYDKNGKPTFADRYYPSRDACLKQAQALLTSFPKVRCIDPKQGRGLPDPELERRDEQSS